MGKIETQDIQCEHPLTYHDFFERFNATSHGYHACPANLSWKSEGVAIIFVQDGSLVASLGAESLTWIFEESAFTYEELILMAQLAATVPEFRGEVSNAD